MISVLHHTNIKLLNGQYIYIGSKLLSSKATSNYWIIKKINKEDNSIILDEYNKLNNNIGRTNIIGILNADWWYLAND